jgi:hypothetical protein
MSGTAARLWVVGLHHPRVNPALSGEAPGGIHEKPLPGEFRLPGARPVKLGYELKVSPLGDPPKREATTNRSHSQPEPTGATALDRERGLATGKASVLH